MAHPVPATSPHTAHAAHAHGADHNYLNAEKGLWSWLTTVDHKRIAVLYLITRPKPLDDEACAGIETGGS